MAAPEPLGARDFCVCALLVLVLPELVIYAPWIAFRALGFVSDGWLHHAQFWSDIVSPAGVILPRDHGSLWNDVAPQAGVILPRDHSSLALDAKEQLTYRSNLSWLFLWTGLVGCLSFAIGVFRQARRLPLASSSEPERSSTLPSAKRTILRRIGLPFVAALLLSGLCYCAPFFAHIISHWPQAISEAFGVAWDFVMPTTFAEALCLDTVGPQELICLHPDTERGLAAAYMMLLFTAHTTLKILAIELLVMKIRRLGEGRKIHGQGFRH